MDSLNSNEDYDNDINNQMRQLNINSNTNVNHDDDDNNNNNQITIAASSLPFPKDGIRLSSISVFYNACGGRDKLIGLTTTEVNDKFLKPITQSSQLSYCELLKSQGGGNDNDIQNTVDNATIGGGWDNDITNTVDNSTIGGG